MIFGKLFILQIFLITSVMANPRRGDWIERPLQNNYEPEIVNWTGEIKEELTSHYADHDLLFLKEDGNKKYSIIESPEILRFHHEINKNYLVEIEAEKTPTFLFWGGKLVIKKFKIISGPSLEEKNSQQSLI